jgi:hypothetical protein
MSPVPMPLWLSGFTATISLRKLRCYTAFAKVGPRDLQVTVAGQRATWEGFYDFAFSCHRDY